jgi:RNA polymerase sigma factor (sigma-70 family)
MVFNLALHYVQNVEDAEEITQDVFEAAYRGLDSFKQQAKHSTWLYRIAINKSLDFIRAKNTQKRFAFIKSIFHKDTGALQHDAPTFNHPGVQLEHKEATQNIFAAINKLPENQKNVVILMKIEGQSQAETAEVLGITTKAVESLFQRAKTNLAKTLNK